MTHPITTYANLTETPTAPANPACENRHPSHTARAIDWYIKIMLLSAGGLIISGIGSAAGVQGSITTPATALFMIGCAHPVIFVSYLALYITGDPHHSIGDASANCHALLWLLLSPYLGCMLFEAGRRFTAFQQSLPAGPVLSPLCVCSLMLAAAIGATCAQTAAFSLHA